MAQRATSAQISEIIAEFVLRAEEHPDPTTPAAPSPSSGDAARFGAPK